MIWFDTWFGIVRSQICAGNVSYLGLSACNISSLFSDWENYIKTPLATNKLNLDTLWLWHESDKPMVFTNIVIMLILFWGIWCKRLILTGRRSPFQQFVAEHLSVQTICKSSKMQQRGKKDKAAQCSAGKLNLQCDAI